MCGIAYMFQPGMKVEEMTSRMESALNIMRHRGPDASGTSGGDDWMIGHRRLSIIDLSSSEQPMFSPDGRFVLTFNGEIYNYRELRGGLSNRWSFQTSGDTEVVLAGILCEGPEFIRKMDGMWAFAFWDQEEKALLMSRDRFGKKPLYYHSDHNSLSLASELPALQTLLGGELPEEDLHSRADYFRHGFFAPGKTLYDSVCEILPGHYAYWRPGAEIESKAYWKLEVMPYTGSYSNACSRFRTLLSESLEKRLVSDVEVGALLSGGVDSSLIVTLLTREFGLSPKTFTIGFKSRSFDESHYARRVAEGLEITNYSETVEKLVPEDFFSLLDNALGQPFGDVSMLPAAKVAELAGRHVKVALCGDGADEVLSGYQRYQGRILSRYYLTLPQKLRSAVTKALKKIPASHSHHSRSLVKKAQLFVSLAERYEKFPQHLTPRLLMEADEQTYFPDLSGFGYIVSHPLGESSPSEVISMMLDDMVNYLPQDILLKSDRSSMYHSLEVRSPFLDYQLAEFAFSLPVSWHRRGLSGKRILRKAYSDMLPSYVLKRRKQGFSVPVSEWLLGDLGDYLKESVRQNPQLGGTGTSILALLDQHRNRTTDYGLLLWSLLVYLRWQHRGS